MESSLVVGRVDPNLTSLYKESNNDPDTPYNNIIRRYKDLMEELDKEHKKFSKMDIKEAASTAKKDSEETERSENEI